MNVLFQSIALLVLQNLITITSCHRDECFTQLYNVVTQTRHVCHGIDFTVVDTREISEELPRYSDDLSLTKRIRRLKRRTKYMKRRIQTLKDEYISARQLEVLLANVSLSQQSCTGITEIGSHRSLSIQRTMELATYLEHDYVMLTKAVGILDLMYDDEDMNEYDNSFTGRIATAKSGVETVVCELFYTIRKLRANLSVTGLDIPDSNVNEDGWYTPVVTSWCPTSTSNCRRERNGIVLLQLTRFAFLLRNNMKAVSY